MEKSRFICSPIREMLIKLKMQELIGPFYLESKELREIVVSFGQSINVTFLSISPMNDIVEMIRNKSINCGDYLLEVISEIVDSEMILELSDTRIPCNLGISMNANSMDQTLLIVQLNDEVVFIPHGSNIANDLLSSASQCSGVTKIGIRCRNRKYVNAKYFFCPCHSEQEEQ